MSVQLTVTRIQIAIMTVRICGRPLHHLLAHIGAVVDTGVAAVTNPRPSAKSWLSRQAANGHPVTGIGQVRRACQRHTARDDADSAKSPSFNREGTVDAIRREIEDTDRVSNVIVSGSGCRR